MTPERWIPPALVLGVASALLQAGSLPAAAGAGIALGLAGLALCAALSSELHGAPRVLVLLVSAWVALGASSLPGSGQPDAGLDQLTLWASCGAAALLSASLIRERSRAWLTSGICIVGAAVAALALGSVTTGDRVAIPFVNPNHLASWLLLPAAMALASLFTVDLSHRGNREATFLWFGLFGAVGAALAATASDGAGLALLASVAGLSLLRFVPHGARLTAVGFAAAALAMALLPALWPQLLPAFQEGGESSPGLRWLLWGSAAHAAWDAMPWGVGLGGFPFAFAAFRPETLRYAPEFAHNEPLQAVVELGLPFLLLAGSSLWLGSRVISQSLHADRGHVGWGAATASLAILAHSLVDFPFHVPVVAVTAAVFAGLVFGGHGVDRAAGDDAGPGRRHWLDRPTVAGARLTLAGLALLLAGLGGTQAWAVLAEQRADGYVASGRFDAAAAAARSGLSARPWRPGLWQRVASSEQHAARFGPGGRARLAAASAAMAQAVRVAPADPALHRELARTLLRARDWAGAERALAAARTRDPASPATDLVDARIGLARGDTASAADSLRAALERHPAALVSTLEALLQVTSDPGLVRSSVPDVPDAHRNAAFVLSHGGYPRGAALLLERVLADTPADAGLASEVAGLHLRAGDARAALASLAPALAAAPGDPTLVSLERRARRAFDPVRP